MVLKTTELNTKIIGTYNDNFLTNVDMQLIILSNRLIEI